MAKQKSVSGKRIRPRRAVVAKTPKEVGAKARPLSGAGGSNARAVNRKRTGEAVGAARPEVDAPPSVPSVPSAPSVSSWGAAPELDGRLALPDVAFPIVGLGASAGGLEAFTQILAALPADTGMAFVVIQHLDPSHKSFLDEALARATSMRVLQLRNRERVQPDHVYVTPPAADISIEGDSLLLVSRSDTSRRSHPHLPIDGFFSDLAAAHGSRSIGVVLSGNASDGTEGLRAIRAAGGITMAQDPRTARFDSMPQHAIAAGVVDFVLPLAGLTAELVRLSRHPYLSWPRARDERADPAPQGEETRGRVTARKTEGDDVDGEAVLTQIKGLVKSVVGVDFGEYKSPTFERRLVRRMALRRIENRETYLTVLERDPDEVRALYEDALIHVSSFFRDHEVFASLKEIVFPEILKGKAQGAPIRIWVAGCSTGEEVYSLAMLLREFLDESAAGNPIQIFGTDISGEAIQMARSGRYSDGAVRKIDEDLRRRYFTKLDIGFRVSKNIRDLCVFVRHDLARDPPFAKLDLVSCRNVLIYFDHPLQRRVLPTFHYALNQPGFLLLGRTEDISGFGRLFSPVDAAHKIFARSRTPSGLRFTPRVEVHPAPDPPLPLPLIAIAEPRRAGEISRQVDNLLLARYAPSGVLVNERLEVLLFRGQTGAYLQAAPGEPQNNLVKMVRTGLLSRLRSTLSRARAQMAPARAEGVEVDQNGHTRTCDLLVIPLAGLPDIKEPLFLVLFEEAAATEPGRRRKLRPSAERDRDARKDAARIPKLEHELSATTEYLQSLIEEHNRTSEELGSANEELTSGNEELQSLNEELETAKEELQSTNEELITVNDELNTRNREVNQVNTDLVNLLNTVEVPILILDRQRRIRRFTPGARNILNVLPSDVGRPLDDIRWNISAPDLDRQISETIETARVKESDVRDANGRWYRMQIHPYKTTESQVDGVIVSLFDIDSLKHHIHKVQQAREDAERADQAKDQFLAVLSHELRTPLSALVMQTQLLRQAGQDEARRARALEAIEHCSHMQVKLIEDLLDVSRIVTGKLKVTLEPVDLAAVVSKALEPMVALATAKGVDLTGFLDDSIGQVAGDQIRLEQIVSNLITNAIKFTPRGGWVRVVLEKAGRVAHLRISDNGMGIDSHFLPRIFNRLTQKDSSVTRTHGGLGLGLAIVRHLVDAHGGTIGAESPGAGLGATFQVSLPLLPEPGRSPVPTGNDPAAAPPDIRPPVNEIDPRLRSRRILVVEDDTSTREALAEMFAAAGAVIRTAQSAPDGLAEVLAFRPDILISDLAMPGEDGFSLIRKVRALPADQGGRTPALALTALAGEAEGRRAISEGFQAYVVKPVDIHRLSQSVADLLQGT